MPERPRVLVREPIAEAGVELLRGRFDVDVDGDSDLAETIGGYDAIVDPFGDQADRRRDRPRRPAEGDRPGRRRRRQRRRGCRHPPRDRRRERARLDGRLGRRADDRPAGRARPQHPAGPCGAEAGHAGSARAGAGSSSPTRRSASSASAGSASRWPGGLSGSGMRVVAYDPFVGDGPVPRGRHRARADARGACSARPTSSRSTSR